MSYNWKGEQAKEAETVSTSDSPIALRKEATVRKCCTVLVCDADGTEGIVAELSGILERAPELSLRTIELIDGAGVNPRYLATRAKTADPDLVFLIVGTKHPTRTMPLFQALRVRFSRCPLIVVAESTETSELNSFLRLGASDFLTLPLRGTEVVPRVCRLLDQTWRGDALVQALKEKLGLKQIIGESPALLRQIQKIPQMARCDATVLISGETGTGKEVFARAVHYLSPRVGQPFITVNCGAVPVELVENELFGHESGAFTSASTAQAGVIQEADGGTLFLDEIDALPLLAQVKLLRFLQEKEYRPLGARKTRRVDTRVVTASSIDFEEAVRSGRFRQDLYYRVNVLPITLPPLRERRDDIPLLARHFIQKYAAEFQQSVREIAPSSMEKLLLYSWPGNVRELENVVQRAMLLCDAPTIQPEDILLPGFDFESSNRSFHALKTQAVAQFERTYLQATLLQHQGNISAAARTAQKNRRAFWELLRKHRLLPPQSGPRL